MSLRYPHTVRWKVKATLTPGELRWLLQIQSVFPEGVLAARSWGGPIRSGGGSENITKEQSTRRAMFRENEHKRPPFSHRFPLQLCAHPPRWVCPPPSLKAKGRLAVRQSGGVGPHPSLPSCAHSPFCRPAEVPPKAQCFVDSSWKQCETLA